MERDGGEEEEFIRTAAGLPCGANCHQEVTLWEARIRSRSMQRQGGVRDRLAVD